MGSNRAAPAEAPLDLPPLLGAPEHPEAPQPRRSSGLRGLSAVLLIALGAASLVVSSASGDRPPARVAGGNLPVNRGATDPADISAHNSPVVARNPVNPANVVVANRIDSPLFSCALHTSFDGGASWSPTAIPEPVGEEPKCYAPDLAFGPDGTMYLSFVTLKGDGNVPNAGWTVLSTDGGRSLSTPRRALGPLAFQVRLAADPRLRGRLYLTWLQAAETATLGFAGDGNPIQFARSDDGGLTWDAPQRVSPPARARVVAPALAIGRTEQIYVSYLDLVDDRLDYTGAHQGLGGPAHGGPWRLVVARSTNGGATWTDTVVDDVEPSERFIVFIPPTPSLAVDASRSRVHVAFHDARSGDTDVWVWTSRDAGASFAAPTRLNDTPKADGTSQYLPKLALAPDGRLDAVYYDRRGDTRNIDNEVSFQASFDGGRTFSPRVRLTDRPFDSRIGPGSERDMPDLGNRLALLSAEHAALAVWADTRAGTDASRKQDLVRAVVAVPEPDELPAALRVGLRVGGVLLVLAGVTVLALLLRRRARGAQLTA